MCYSYLVRFEWDAGKARANKRRHDVTFEEASECFYDPLAVVIDEPRYADRSILIGESRERRLVFTVYLQRIDDDTIRIISARDPTRAERRTYAENEG